MSAKDEPKTGRDAVSFGIEDLIDRLRDEGVEKGRNEAERIVADAEARARWLVKQAQEEADRLVDRARNEAQSLQRSADDALQVAARDMLLSLRERLTHRFAGEVRRLVGEQLEDTAFVKRLILEIAGTQRESIGEDAEMEILLPRRALEVSELRSDPGELKDGELTHFVLGITDEMLREGVTIKLRDTDQAGITAKLVDDEIEVEVTADAVAALLLKHLQPRFRALLEGIVRG